MGEPNGTALSTVWRPLKGPQERLCKLPGTIDEVFFGGARGGGKTDGMLGKFALKAQKHGEHCVGVFFRRTREDLKEAIARSRQIYTPLGAKYAAGQGWTFPTGARLKFEYLDRDSDADNYQGHNYTDLFFEEIQHWPTPKPVNKLRATLRSPVGVPCQFHGTGNPGGVGHHWVKERYIDPAPQGYKILWEEFENPFTNEIVKTNRIFIPSKLTDNKYLGSDYVARLYQSGNEELVRAWLEGDWSVITGAFFDCWRNDKHIIQPFVIPDHWLRFRAMDWGSAAPFCVLWFAVVSEDTWVWNGTRSKKILLPRGCLVVYREWYGAKGHNEGIKLHAAEVGTGIKSREDGENISYGVLDPAAFAEDGGPSIAERLFQNGANFRRADNKRVGVRGAMGGWDQMRGRLVGDADGNPMLVYVVTCTHSIRTIPALQHDPDKPEDLDTDSEDHPGDTTRYGCMSRPWSRPQPKPEKDPYKEIKPPTLQELVSDHDRKMRNRENRI